MPQSVNLLTVQFLVWVASRPRTYTEAKEAWRSTCPMTCAWEDAISDGLIQFGSGSEKVTDHTTVTLTPRGRALLDGR